MLQQMLQEILQKQKTIKYEHHNHIHHNHIHHNQIDIKNVVIRSTTNLKIYALKLF
jgi:hypothetical protein